MHQAPRFITITTKDNSVRTGLPKVLAINIDGIVMVEPAIYDMPINMDTAETEPMEGSMVMVQASAHHVLEIESRDPADAVMDRIALAGGVVTDRQEVNDARS